MSDQETWEKLWTDEFVQDLRLYEIWAHGDGINRRVASRVYSDDADRIVADHNNAQENRQLAARAALADEALELLDRVRWSVIRSVQVDEACPEIGRFFDSLTDAPAEGG